LLGVWGKQRHGKISCIRRPTRYIDNTGMQV
jgi:hypothetical protein